MCQAEQNGIRNSQAAVVEASGGAPQECRGQAPIELAREPGRTGPHVVVPCDHSRVECRQRAPKRPPAPVPTNGHDPTDDITIEHRRVEIRASVAAGPEARSGPARPYPTQEAVHDQDASLTEQQDVADPASSR